jgi:uncharacterized protein YhaN
LAREKRMEQLRTEIEKIEEEIKGVDEKIDKVDEKIDKVDEKIDKVDEKMKEMKKEMKEVDEMIKEVDKELILPRNEEEKLRKLEDRKRLVVRINELLEESKGLLEERKGLVEERKWYVQRRQITNEIDTIIQDFEDSNIALRLHSPVAPSCDLSCQNFNEARVCLLQSVLDSLGIQKDNDLLPPKCLDRNVDGFLDLPKLLDPTSESKCQGLHSTLQRKGELWPSRWPRWSDSDLLFLSFHARRWSRN